MGELRLLASDAARRKGVRGCARRARVDSGVQLGYKVPSFYDSLLAKVSVWDTNRERATARMLRALGEFELEGPASLVPFHRAFLASRQWAAAETGRDLLLDPDWLAATEPAAAPDAG